MIHTTIKLIDHLQIKLKNIINSEPDNPTRYDEN